MSKMAIVTPSEFREARASLLREEKAATRLLSSLAEQRRALPAVQVPNPARFTFTYPTPNGGDSEPKRLTLLDLFEGRRQLIIYFHMPFPSPGVACTGCSFFSDNVPAGAALAHLHSRDTTFAAAAAEPVASVAAFGKRMGWEFPFYSSEETFAGVNGGGEGGQEGKEDLPWRPPPGGFRLSCFVREGDEVFHTYETSSRGVEVVLSTYALLDMTKLGRQEGGEEPKRFRLHDQYE